MTVNTVDAAQLVVFSAWDIWLDCGSIAQSSGLEWMSSLLGERVCFVFCVAEDVWLQLRFGCDVQPFRSHHG